ncbi:hypothetical protein BBK82_17845 [Lentzea guizhouensis]|uniref:Uncharacterized protein n=1 Tax=Lentzea guizhouensis TaxID=1586287 RepID=A0A1B2HIS9_9PSEU|nr:hypothetical protein [Lentzea guizhouensis]ANZ37638.1 hypothetical protein BBK82_17845 [Lentzea guizhouensis]
MSIAGDVDPKIQALFDENIAKTRRATAEVTATLQADQDRLAAEARAREEKHQRDLATARESAENLAKQGDKPQRKPQWEQRDRSAGELAFGPEDDEGYAQPASTQAPPPAQFTPPPPPQQFTPPPPPPPPARSRRPARVDDDDDDLSGQTWLR